LRKKSQQRGSPALSRAKRAAWHMERKEKKILRKMCLGKEKGMGGTWHRRQSEVH